MITEYTEESFIGPGSLGKDDLIELVQIMGYEIIGDYGFETIIEFGDTKEKWDSLEQLFDNTKSPNNPDEITIRLWQPKHYNHIDQIEKGIDIKIGEKTLVSSVSVSGGQKTWVHGKYDQLINWFDDKLGGKNRKKIEMLFGNNFSASIIIGLWILVLLYVYDKANVLLSFIFFVSSIYLIFNYISWTIGGTFRKKVKVYIKPKIQPRIFGIDTIEFIKIVIPLLFNIFILIITRLK